MRNLGTLSSGYNSSHTRSAVERPMYSPVTPHPAPIKAPRSYYQQGQNGRTYHEYADPSPVVHAHTNAPSSEMDWERSIKEEEKPEIIMKSDHEREREDTKFRTTRQASTSTASSSMPTQSTSYVLRQGSPANALSPVHDPKYTSGNSTYPSTSIDAGIISPAQESIAQSTSPAQDYFQDQVRLYGHPPPMDLSSEEAKRLGRVPLESTLPLIYQQTFESELEPEPDTNQEDERNALTAVRRVSDRAVVEQQYVRFLRV